MSSSLTVSFANAVLNVNRQNVKEYLSSLHFFPVVATAAVAPAIYMAGHGQLALISLYSGLAVMAFVTWLSPILKLHPLCGPYRVGFKELNATKDSEGNGCPPLTLVYPTTQEADTVADWLPFKDTGYLRGMAAYVHVPFFVVRDIQLTQMEVLMDAKTHPLIRKDGSQRPIFVHSHGLAGYPRLYSLFLSTVAAHGAFVVGVNHMDRSAAFCRDATNDFRIPIDNTLKWTYRDREPQLRMRVQEMRNTIAEVLNGNVLRQLGIPDAEVDQYVSSNPQVVLMGHSFGGATALATAHEEEKKMRAGQPNFYEAIAGVVAHDPWCVPLWGRFMKPEAKDGAEVPEALLNFSEEQATYSIPTLLHHSQAWREDTLFWDFFSKLHNVMHAQAEKKDLLIPEQRRRIEEATARMRKAMAGPEDSSPSAAAATVEDWFVTHTAPETAHLSITDMSFLSPVVFKKSYQTNRPEAPIHQWANEAIRFAEIHVEKNIKL